MNIIDDEKRDWDSWKNLSNNRLYINLIPIVRCLYQGARWFFRGLTK